MNPRRDMALVLARGRSRRMGSPKGLCRLDPDGPTFLESIALLYTGRGVPIAVITSHDLQATYADIAQNISAKLILHHEQGGTATSVLAGARQLQDVASHLWLHPVDLPQVMPSTLDRLARRSQEQPDKVVIPEYKGIPGHPVVLPIETWSPMNPDVWPGPMQDLLRRRPDELCILETTDGGICRDYDSPEELNHE
jgi:molybdenum cofactor cytidylyltransferase